ncbi:hypothetical protein NXV14_09235 [Bacteroides fragilis]|nr:hypothetical protein [Bacteroides fragilis]
MGRLTFGLKRPWRTSRRTAKCGKSWSIIRITEKSSERRRPCGRPGEKQEISSLTDLELSKQLGNAKSNISKGKNELEKAPDEEKRVKAMEKTRKWTERKNLLEAEMESKKKN